MSQPQGTVPLPRTSRPKPLSTPRPSALTAPRQLSVGDGALLRNPILRPCPAWGGGPAQTPWTLALSSLPRPHPLLLGRRVEGVEGGERLEVAGRFSKANTILTKSSLRRQIRHFSKNTSRPFRVESAQFSWPRLFQQGPRGNMPRHMYAAAVARCPCAKPLPFETLYI
jgi:hypothetical protein